MKLQKVILAAAFAMTVLASAQGHAANNNGQPESALRASVAVQMPLLLILSRKNVLP
ncbi:MAG: hypothetical protein IPK95_05255 [Cellvibrionales bacterium]|nr:hypothetical protein [Cellvibrionales bacterium]